MAVLGGVRFLMNEVPLYSTAPLKKALRLSDLALSELLVAAVTEGQLGVPFCVDLRCLPAST